MGQGAMIHRFSWRFPVDHPALPGHFPHHPIAPGVVLLDRLELFARSIPVVGDGRWCVERAKFLQTVSPGDLLAFVFEAERNGGCDFRIEREASLVVHGSMLARSGRST
jgi:3-hydroxyacyl-[acyl-carrier-protein] dehydratase